MVYITEQRLLYEVYLRGMSDNTVFKNLYRPKLIAKFIENQVSYKYLTTTFLKQEDTKPMNQFLKSPIAIVLGNNIQKNKYITLQKIIYKEYMQ